ncbi:MAG TPA: CBS domain-containing protein [Gemmatimonadales bacterium]
MGADERLALAFMEAHPEGAARLLERAGPVEAAALLADVPVGVAAGVLRLMAPAAVAGCAAALPVERLAEIVGDLPLDAAAGVMHRLDPERREAVLVSLPVTAEAPLRRLLAYGAHTAGALADPLVLALPEDLTVAEAQRRLRGGGEHLFYYLYIVARDGRLVGVLDIPELMAARPRDTLGAAMHRDPVRLEAGTGFVTLAAHPAWQELDALPVVDGHGRLVGALRHKAVRRLEAELGLRARNESVIATLVGLSELYWAGLSGLFPRVAAAEPPVSPPAETRPSEEVPDAR